MSFHYLGRFALPFVVAATVLGGEVADYYIAAPKHNPAPVVPGLPRMATAHGITEIGIERSRCRGDCPAYTFIMRSDGTCRYHGAAHVDFIGERVGRIDPVQFHNLAAFISESAFWSMPDTYRRGATDGASVYSTFTAGSRRKTFKNHMQSAPSKVWALEQLIDAAAQHVVWESSPAATAPPTVAPK